MLAPRDIIRISVGMGEQPEGRRALEPLGKRSPLHGVDSYRVVFWIPPRPGSDASKRDENRVSAAPDATSFELQRIRDGVIEEVVLEWGCKKEAPEEWRIRACKQAWWNLARSRVGHVVREPVVAPLSSPAIEARDFENRRLVVQ